MKITRVTRMLSVLFVFGVLNFILPFHITHASAATYYVANAGNDSCDGTSQTIGTSGSCSWKTIAKVNTSSFNPGDSILFNKGDIWREQLTVPSSGTAGNPITFGAYGSGALPIIDGADVYTGWTPEIVNAVEDFTDGTGPKPISWWMFEDAAATAADGNGANANTLTWAASSAQAATHMQGTYSLSTPNTTGAVLRSYANLSANFPGKAATTELTVGGWIYLKGNAPAFSEIQAFGDESTKGWYCDTGTIGKLRCSMWAISGKKIAIADNAITTDGWHHIAMRWNGANRANSGANQEVSLWVDGVKQLTTATAADMVLPTTQNLLFKGNAAAVINYDEWFVFNQAITDTQMNAIYQYGLAGERGAVITGYYTSATTHPRIVTDNDALLATPNEVSTKALLSAGSYFWESSTNRLYIRLSGDVDPTTHTIEAGVRNYCVDSNSKNYLTFQYLQFQRSNSVVVDVGSCLHLFSTPIGITIDHSIITQAAFSGFIVAGNADSLTVSNSTISYNGTRGGVLREDSASTNVNLLDSTWNANGWLAGQASGADSGFYGNMTSGEVARNTLTNNGLGGAIGAEHGIYLGAYGSNYNVHDNLCTGNTHGSGIKVRGNGSIYNNNCNNNYYGIQVGGNISNATYFIYNNLAYSNTSAGIIEQLKGAGTITFSAYNNTLYSNAGGASDSQVTIADSLAGLDLRNNLISVTASLQTVDVQTIQTGTVTIDNNLVYHTSDASPYKYAGTAKTLAEWQALGFDASGSNSNPLFTNPSGSNFTLLSTSPAVDTGVNLGTTYKLGLDPTSIWPSSVLTLDQTQNGTGWDLGAYVYPNYIAPVVASVAAARPPGGHRHDIPVVNPPFTPPTSITPPSPSFTTNHKVGDKGPDIKNLQIYLNDHGFTIAASGPGSKGNETSTFGSLTYKALINYQKSKGLPATGWFGPMTRGAMGSK